jgi:prepilin-type N-terminal cleavage/methylation domain-containing protein
MTLEFRKLQLNRPNSAGGFTITELLVVVAIIVLLSSIGLVVGKKAFGAADKTRLRAQLHTIELALDAYKNDFGSYPTTDPVKVTSSGIVESDEINEAGMRGARILCKALLAPTPGFNANNTGHLASYEDQDGKVGPGFRLPGRSGTVRFDNKNTPSDLTDDELHGKDYGPYIQGGAIKWSKTNDDGSLNEAKDYDDTTVLLDANDNVIVYYPALNPQANLAVERAFVGAGPIGPSPASAAYPLPMYRFTDNSTWISESLLKKLLGDRTEDGAINRFAGENETAAVKAKPLLISSGRDGIFGPNPNDKNKTNDDVTNFND